MSERYGAPGELQERLEDFEDWVHAEIAELREEFSGAPLPRAIFSRWTFRNFEGCSVMVGDRQ